MEYPGVTIFVQMLQRFVWFDESLQSYMRARGWPDVTRPQSMVMANLVTGYPRPAEMARRLGISRQAVHTTIDQLIRAGLVVLEPDPANSRLKLVRFTPLGEQRRKDAQEGMKVLNEELSRRIGKARFKEMADGIAAEWGPTMVFAAPKSRRRKSD